MVTEKLLTTYTEAVENAYPKVREFIFGELSTEEYIHVIQIATDVLLSRDGHQKGGHFVQAIVDNKLSEAFDRSDSVCERAIKFFVYCRNFVDVKQF